MKARGKTGSVQMIEKEMNKYKGGESMIYPSLFINIIS